LRSPNPKKLVIATIPAGSERLWQVIVPTRLTLFRPTLSEPHVRAGCMNLECRNSSLVGFLLLGCTF
jgi:hypothetical protein